MLNYPLNRFIHLLTGGLICFTPVQRLVFPEEQNIRLTEIREEKAALAPDIKGYRDIVFYKGKFLAVGTDGRIDYIDIAGEKTPVLSLCKNNLNCIIGDDQILIVGGDNGTILLSSDGQVFSKVESGTDKTLTELLLREAL